MDIKCYFHHELPAVATDSIVDVENSKQFDVAYRRVPICWMCEQERKAVNTSRIESLVGGARWPMR